MDVRELVLALLHNHQYKNGLESMENNNVHNNLMHASLFGMCAPFSNRQTEVNKDILETNEFQNNRTENKQTIVRIETITTIVTTISITFTYTNKYLNLP